MPAAVSFYIRPTHYIEHAAFTTLGAIALQGLRVAEVQLGENIGVIGLGLVGQLTVQLLHAAGCNVFGIDVQTSRIDLARQSSAHDGSTPDKAASAVNAFTHNRGLDAVLIATRRNLHPDKPPPFPKGDRGGFHPYGRLQPPVRASRPAHQNPPAKPPRTPRHDLPHQRRRHPHRPLDTGRNRRRGRIIGEVCHFIDLMVYLTQAHPVSVHAQTTAPTVADFNQDTLAITLTFSDGSLGAIQYFANGDTSASKERLEVFCEKSLAILEDFRREESIQDAIARSCPPDL